MWHTSGFLTDSVKLAVQLIIMKTYQILLSGCLLAVTCSCGTAFLDIKPDRAQRVPETIADYRGLLDQTAVMNVKSSHALGMIGGDEYLITDARYHAFPLTSNRAWQKNAYTWEAVIFEGGEGNPTNNPSDWNMGYQRILQANVAIAGLSRIQPDAGQKALWETAMGEALFHRAFNYYSLAQLFCDPYTHGAAPEPMGLPLRLEPDVTLETGRSDLRATYRRVVEDLAAAEKLLPDTPDLLFRPSKAAVFALLARVFLQMGDYRAAGENADRCLSLQDGLQDYNALVLTGARTFPVYGNGNPEIIFMNSVYVPTIMGTSYFNADPGLFNLYGPGDLRKEAFFAANASGAVLFKGSYEGTTSFFTGLATDEVFLVSAECAARLGDVTTAIARLNRLRENRFRLQDYVPLATTDSDEALDWVVAERRRELVLRGTRWEDLRRLNAEPRHAVTLVREIDGAAIALLPRDVRYTWPIPQEAVEQGGYVQNKR